MVHWITISNSFSLNIVCLCFFVFFCFQSTFILYYFQPVIMIKSEIFFILIYKITYIYLLICILPQRHRLPLWRRTNHSAFSSMCPFLQKVYKHGKWFLVSLLVISMYSWANLKLLFSNSSCIDGWKSFISNMVNLYKCFALFFWSIITLVRTLPLINV